MADCGLDSTDNKLSHAKPSAVHSGGTKALAKDGVGRRDCLRHCVPEDVAGASEGAVGLLWATNGAAARAGDVLADGLHADCGDFGGGVVSNFAGGVAVRVRGTLARGATAQLLPLSPLGDSGSVSHWLALDVSCGSSSQ